MSLLPIVTSNVWRKRSSLWFKQTGVKPLWLCLTPTRKHCWEIMPILPASSLSSYQTLTDLHPSQPGPLCEFPPGFQASHWRSRPMSSLNPALGTTFSPSECLPLSTAFAGFPVTWLGAVHAQALHTGNRSLLVLSRVTSIIVDGEFPLSQPFLLPPG